MKLPVLLAGRQGQGNICAYTNTRLVLIALLLTAGALAQQASNAKPTGMIHGVAIGLDGLPAQGIGLTAFQLGVGFGAILPHTKTNQTGEYRFGNLDFGKYIIYADDEVAGYSSFSTGPDWEDGHPSGVELTTERRDAEFRVSLPPKAAFLQIHLTNRKTGTSVSAMRIALMSAEQPISPIFTMSCYSNQVILIPPDKQLLLHVSSDGFPEWGESVGQGKSIHLSSGERLTLDVQLAPSKD